MKSNHALQRKRHPARMGGRARGMLRGGQDFQGEADGFQRAGTKSGMSWFFAAGNRRMRSRKYSHGSILRRRQLTITE